MEDRLGYAKSEGKTFSLIEYLLCEIFPMWLHGVRPQCLFAIPKQRGLSDGQPGDQEPLRGAIAGVTNGHAEFKSLTPIGLRLMREVLH